MIDGPLSQLGAGVGDLLKSGFGELFRNAIGVNGNGFGGGGGSAIGA